MRGANDAPFTTLSAFIALTLCLLCAPTQAQDTVANFYRGKQINVIVSTGVGGGFDLYARMVARYLGRHIPGNPTVVVQNMPPAGGLVAMNYLYDRAASDGLTIGMPQATLLYAQIGKSPSVKFDMRGYSWLGTANVTSTTCIFTEAAGIRSAEDLLSKKVIVGGTGGSTEFIPHLLNALIGTKFNVVKGYRSTNETFPAMERGEINGVCGLGWDSARVVGRDYFARGVFSVGLECADERHPELAARGVPYVMDLAKDEETKNTLRFLFGYLLLQRPFVGPPDIPADRLKALQDAFAATLKDPALLAEAGKSGTEIRYESPERVRVALDNIFNAPAAIQARGIDELRKAGWLGLQR